MTVTSDIKGGFLGSSAGKESACNAGDSGLIPGSERSAGEGLSYPLQYSGLENSMDYIVHWVSKNQTQLSDFHFISLLTFKCCPGLWYFRTVSSPLIL